MAKKTLKEAKKMFEGIKKLQVFSPIKQKDDDQNKHWLTDEECLERFGLLLDEIRLEVFFKTGIILDNEKIW